MCPHHAAVVIKPTVFQGDFALDILSITKEYILNFATSSYLNKVFSKQNDISVVFSQQKFQSLKRLQRSPLNVENLLIIVAKFEETGSFNVCSGRHKKPVSVKGIEKIAIQLQEFKASNIQTSTSIVLLIIVQKMCLIQVCII